jgi:hypothetical protein
VAAARDGGLMMRASTADNYVASVLPQRFHPIDSARACGWAQARGRRGDCKEHGLEHHGLSMLTMIC